MDLKKFKRLDDDQPYEDGDNFDAHVSLKVISNPYEMFEKHQTDESDEEEIPDIQKPEEPDKLESILLFKKPATAATSKMASQHKRVKQDEPKVEKEIPKKKDLLSLVGVYSD